MIVYKATKKEFLEDFRKEKIVKKITQKYIKSIAKPNYGIINSWNGSIPYLYLLLEDENIPDDCGISIEHTIPNIDTKKRIDVMITGKNKNKENVAIIIELKQWSKVEQPADRVGYIVTSNIKDKVIRVHPSFQAYSYMYFLKTYNSAFTTNNIKLYSCAFLHNYELIENDPLFDNKYKNFIKKSPLFLRGDIQKLRKFITEKIWQGDECETINIIDDSTVSITGLFNSKTFDIMKNAKEMELIDEQEIVYEKALEMAKKTMEDNKKRVFIVKGGPGTGKSILAIKILADIFLRPDNKIEKASFITPIQAQREVYKYTIKKEEIYKPIIQTFKSAGEFTEAIKDKNDVAIIDEAHRLKEKSGFLETKGENQIKEIIIASKFSIFFIDELQRVTVKDKGSVSEIIKRAKEQNAIVEEYELESQFRCSGSSGYISWVENALEMKGDYSDSNMNYDVSIVDDPNKLRKIIRKKNRKNNSSRIVAGYCWDSKKPSRARSDIYDIEIPEYNFYMSWNLINEPWAVAEDSVERAGCIYTCQGLEFDYVGVIIGKDLIYRNGKVEVDSSKKAKTDGALKGINKLDLSEEEKNDLIVQIIKNTYRILLTRGKEGCIIYCEDKELNEHFKRKLKQVEKGVV